MNWIFMLDWVYKVKANFWWEVSLWDGNNEWTPDRGYAPELLKKSKACQYIKDGQTYTPDRYEGWAQFGLWLLRPRVMREFRGSTVPLEPWQSFFERLLRIVDRVYDNEILRDFWRYGVLVPNNAHRHPYQEGIPGKYRDIHRWYLLDTSLDSARPWDSKTNIPVFSLALAQGTEGSRRWLLYAHAPLEYKKDVEITIPDYGSVIVEVTRSGAFYLIEEQSKIIAPITFD
jgi:hypothetical protein